MNEQQKPGDTAQDLLVQKFGGTSLADLKGFDASAKVIAQYVDDYRVIVVLSAVKGVTDLLLAAIDTSVAGEDGGEHLEEAIRRERAIVSDLASGGFATPQATSYLDEQEAVLSRMVEGIRLLGQCPDETRARILATGEGFASRLMVDVLQARGYDALWSDTDVLPPANDDWLDSLVDVEAAAHLREEVEMVRELCPAFDREAFLAGNMTPVFFGSAVNNFGVRTLLDSLAELAETSRPERAQIREPFRYERSIGMTPINDVRYFFYEPGAEREVVGFSFRNTGSPKINAAPIVSTSGAA